MILQVPLMLTCRYPTMHSWDDQFPPDVCQALKNVLFTT